jgi:hypothetical protein
VLPLRGDDHRNVARFDDEAALVAASFFPLEATSLLDTGRLATKESGIAPHAQSF